MVEMELVRARLSDETVRPLLNGLVEEYGARYGPGHDAAIADIENFHPPAQDFDPPAGMFIVAVEDGRTIGGGGFRRLSAEVCELKRMWTDPAHRRRGVASSILDALESGARHQGYRLVRLETAPVQIEALSFYGGRGYHETAMYGEYAVAIALERTLASD
jgi:GNAT superfamily N-acetyltransferase